jgi:GNAT superfamily N-acetyltransferase
MSISPSLPADRAGILDAARRAAVFTEEEVRTVGELFEDFLRDAAGTGYYFLTYRDGQRVLGFACWGPTDLTAGTADLYWICAAPEAQGRGVGSALFHAVEEEVRAVGRWLIIIWTSGQPAFAAARKLYERTGCELAARIPDFFDHGDDLCLYTRRLIQP